MQLIILRKIFNKLFKRGDDFKKLPNERPEVISREKAAFKKEHSKLREKLKALPINSPEFKSTAAKLNQINIEINKIKR